MDNKSIKLPDGYSWDSSSVTHERVPLNEKLKDVYSTEEVKTSKVWIDGKPIYRKVVTGTVTNSNGDQAIATISDLGQIITIKGIIYSNYSQWWNIPGHHSETGYDTSIRCNVIGQVNLEVGSFYSNGKPFIVILEYTKTTD